MRLSHPKGKRQQESISRVTQYPLTIEELVGQYASMHGKNLVETVIEQVWESMDEHGMGKLEDVAADKVVRCVRNRREDPSSPQRHPKEPIQRPSTVILSSDSLSSNDMYAPDDEIQEDDREEHGEQGETQAQYSNSRCQRRSLCKFWR